MKIVTAIIICSFILSAQFNLNAQTNQKIESGYGAATKIDATGIRLYKMSNSLWDEAINDPSAKHLARPTEAQFKWQELERAMFVQLDPATHQQGEYDNGTTPLSQLTFEKLNVNEWCEVAKSWGANELNFMLAHSGGFCMWPSKTTDYDIGNTPYKGGKGDIVAEYAKACKRHKLKMGFFIWSPLSKEHQAYYGGYWTHGSDDTPVKNGKESSAITAARLKELHERLGSKDVVEIWLDLPRFLSLGDKIDEYFPNAVIMAIGCSDPIPTIRWPGAEDGVVHDPCWSTLNKANLGGTKLLANGMPAPGNHNDNESQTQNVDDPDGDYWAPHEADVPLHDHFWHMRPDALNHRRSVEQLINCYEKSVGQNSFLMLNCAPMPDGSIHPDDKQRYKEFGAEINRRFGHPIKEKEQIAGHEVVIEFNHPQNIAYSDLWEDYRYGQRIREYVIEGMIGDKWVELAHGTSVGRRKIDPIHSDKMSKIRVRITKSVGTPLIRKFQVHQPTNKK